MKLLPVCKRNEMDFYAMVWKDIQAVSSEKRSRGGTLTYRPLPLENV